VEKPLKKISHLCLSFAIMAGMAFAGQKSVTLPTKGPQKQAGSAELARALGWTSDPGAQNLCRGYYEEPWLTYQSQGLASSSQTKISADSGSIQFHGKSTVTGHVIVIQDGRQLKAERADIFRNAKTGKIERVHLYGNVRVREPGRLLIGNKAFIRVPSESGDVWGATYRLARSDQLHRVGSIEHLYGTNVWGQAARINRDSKGNFHFYQGSYTSCPPPYASWRLYAKKFTLNKAKGKAYARNVVLRLHGVPVFYSPYLSFSTDDRRKSGFLKPSFSYSNRTGVVVSAPFYWNIAPNYDATFMPRYLSKRGFWMGGQARMLTHNSHGSIDGSFIPYDKRFKHFRKENDINSWGNARGALHINHYANFNNGWQSHIDYNGVTDDYYFQDFQSDLYSATQNQLHQQWVLSYWHPHWQFVGNLDKYQTLHAVNQTDISDVYSHLPQLLLSTEYPFFVGPGQFQMTTEYVNFNWPSNAKTLQQMNGKWRGVRTLNVEGQRWRVVPALRFPFKKSYGFFTPAIKLHASYYDLSYPGGLQASKQTYHLRQNIDRVIPIVSIDSGLYFDKIYNTAHSHYRQTIEPRVFYLMVPKISQRDIPDFDSAYHIFTFEQLFRDNRFSGNDRIGDTNQISLGLTTRFINQDTGFEKLRMSIGQAVYFRKREVRLCNAVDAANPIADCQENLETGFTDPVNTVSPLAGLVVYHLTPAWSLQGSGAVNVVDKQVRNVNADLHYQPAPAQVIDLNYTFLRNGDTTQTFPVTKSDNLHQAGIASSWYFTQNWQGLGIFRYNISKEHPQSYYIGLGYDSCCWAVRGLAGRRFNSVDNTGKRRYTNSVFLQIIFKGLTTLANKDPQDILTSEIPGYHDTFGE
jgi:LPS-assembly protein